MIQTILRFPNLSVDLLKANCPFPNKFFPYGFEFSLCGVNAAMDDDTKDIIYNPSEDGDVLVYCLEEEADVVLQAFKEPGLYASGDMECGDFDCLNVPYSLSEQILGVTRWKLVDLLWQQRENELYDEIMVRILDRDFVTKKVNWIE
jgi:hypothetical protein